MLYIVSKNITMIHIRLADQSESVPMLPTEGAGAREILRSYIYGERKDVQVLPSVVQELRIMSFYNKMFTKVAITVNNPTDTK